MCAKRSNSYRLSAISFPPYGRGGGVGRGRGVGVGLGPGVAVGLGVGVGAAPQLSNLKLTMRVRQLNELVVE
ncbi:MAG: hypothetical protein DME33_11925 [Verrucomicrobia bacterium]|nr:MAG: hypothetical protein DME33_11925 [Verrucomicrobiota bacterium]